MGPKRIETYITLCSRMQASAVFEAPPGSGRMLWLGNQWVTAPARNADLLCGAGSRFKPPTSVMYGGLWILLR